MFELFRAGYVTGFNVTQRGAGANMSVDVQVGTALIEDTDRTYPAWFDAIENVTISAADPTNPRRDIVVAYEDKSVVSSASPNNPGALKFLAVAGTPAGSPVDPSGGTIQTAVGASNPYISLARVAVAAASSSVVNANITDLRNPAALAVPYVYGGGSNTKGHLVPNVADDTVALLAATQTLTGKTLTSPTINTATISSPSISSPTLSGTVPLPNGWTGLVRQRQGGTTGDATWQTTGTSNTDTSAKGVFIQAGSILTSSGGATTVTYPVAYSQAPLVMVCVENGGGTGFWANVNNTPSTTSFDVVAWSNTSSLAAKTVNWMAIGQ